MSTKIETTVGELNRLMSGLPADRRVSLVVEDSDEDKLREINAMLAESRASGTVDGERALTEIRAGFLRRAAEQAGDME